MSVRRIKGTFISRFNPWFQGADGSPYPLAMTVLLRFDGEGGVIGKLVRRGFQEMQPATIVGTYTLVKNTQFMVYEGHMRLLVDNATHVRIYIVRRTVDEVNMNHVVVQNANGPVPILANGILRRERHGFFEWLLDPSGPERVPVPEFPQFDDGRSNSEPVYM